jgi:hypothetical protein
MRDVDGAGSSGVKPLMILSSRADRILEANFWSVLWWGIR